jgi:hypothetical protein
MWLRKTRKTKRRRIEMSIKKEAKKCLFTLEEAKAVGVILFPPTPPPPHTSSTSEAAAAAIYNDTSKLRSTIFLNIAALGEYGATCYEIEVALCMRHQTASARLWELYYKFDKIRHSGIQRKTGSGRKAWVWVTKEVALVMQEKRKKEMSEEALKEETWEDACNERQARAMELKGDLDGSRFRSMMGREKKTGKIG